MRMFRDGAHSLECSKPTRRDLGCTRYKTQLDDCNQADTRSYHADNLTRAKQILAYQCTARRLIHATHYVPKPSHDARSVWMVALCNCVLLPVINIYLPVQLIGDIHRSIFYE